MRKTIMSFTLTVILLSNGITILHAQTPEVIAQNTKASTVLLEMKDIRGRATQGSGFFVGDRIVATNYHVINGAKSGTAKLVGENSLNRQRRYEIQGVVAMDENHDLAIIQVDTLNAPPLPFGNSDSISVGELVYAVGNPHGFEGTFSSGEISNIRTQGTPRIKDKVLQFTAAISRGSSGGAVVNRVGEVVGIVTETHDDGQNLNFAIPVNNLKTLLKKVGPLEHFPSDVSFSQKKQLVYPFVLLITSVVVFVVIWFIPTVKIEALPVAIGVALGFGAIKAMFTAILRSESLPIGIKVFLNSVPPKDIVHAVGCENCVVSLIFYVIKLPIYLVLIAFLLSLTNSVVRKFELNGFFNTFFIALLIVLGEIMIRLLLFGS